MQYTSIKGGGYPVDFQTAILDGFAQDGGLYVPTSLPKVSKSQLEKWKNLSYIDLAFEVLSLFIDRSNLSEDDLRLILNRAYSSFEKKDVVAMQQLQSCENTYIMELFHGPTISFKDVGLAFLVTLVDFFLEKKGKHLSIIVATTGDTGPATAHFTAGKAHLDAWLLYPKGKITVEQERQMTTLPNANIHPVGVTNCPKGGDDLDAVISSMFANRSLKEKLRLSSVNSINWGRVMMQTVHYFYGYFRVANTIGEQVHFSVPSGGFGNVCAGALARMMGLPIGKIIVANNQNACLHRIFSQRNFSLKEIKETISSAIDILIPTNFWRYLYFSTDQDAGKIKSWMDEFYNTGKVNFDNETWEMYRSGFLSHSATDEETIAMIKKIYNAEKYLLDPHGVVAVVASQSFENELDNKKTVCLATAHPAKFPDTIQHALSIDQLPPSATHQSITNAKNLPEKKYIIDHEKMEEKLISLMENKM